MIPMTFRNIQIDATNHRGRGKAFSINPATIIRMVPIMPHTAHRPQIKRCFLSICFPLNAYQKTFTVVTAPKSTESTNSIISANLSRQEPVGYTCFFAQAVMTSLLSRTWWPRTDRPSPIVAPGQLRSRSAGALARPLPSLVQRGRIILPERS